jgi:hypothetical protein
VDTHFPFKIIGISSHENDYRLIWAINSKLNLAFSRIGEFKTLDESGKGMEFSRFFLEDESRFISFYIISNRCSQGFLLPEYRTMDYFLFLKGELDDNYPEILIKRLKSVEIISIAFLIEKPSGKTMKKLMHLDA